MFLLEPLLIIGTIVLLVYSAQYGLGLGSSKALESRAKSIVLRLEGKYLEFIDRKSALETLRSHGGKVDFERLLNESIEYIQPEIDELFLFVAGNIGSFSNPTEGLSVFQNASEYAANLLNRNTSQVGSVGPGQEAKLHQLIHHSIRADLLKRSLDWDLFEA